MNDEYLSVDDLLPDPPKIEKVDLDACRSTGDFRPILFEYYRNIAILVAICGNIKNSSHDWSGRSGEYYVVQVGLLNRMHRILAGHLEFFQDGRYGDLTLILDRCLLETAVKIRWLSRDQAENNLRRFFEDSLRVDSELLDSINANIGKRLGKVLPIEQRMLDSIAFNAKLAGVDLEGIRHARKAPPLSAMVEAIGERRYIYTVVGKTASHAVHGSWANLLHCYLDGDSIDSIVPKAIFPPAHINQYAFNMIFVLDACYDYVHLSFSDGVERTTLLSLFNVYKEEILTIYQEVVGGDFD